MELRQRAVDRVEYSTPKGCCQDKLPVRLRAVSQCDITRNLRAAVRLWDTIAVGGVVFLPRAPYEVDATATVEGDGYGPAVEVFDQLLLVALDSLTLVTGAAVSALGASTLAAKRRSKYVYLHAVHRRPSAHLTIVPQYHDELVRQSDRVASVLTSDPRFRNSAAFLRQAAISESLATTAFSLLQAAEAQAAVARSNKTNRRELKRLMGDEAYDFFYTRDPLLGDTRRNALAHGRLIDQVGMQPVGLDLQRRLLSSLRQHFSVTAQPAFSPVRGFVTYERIPRFLEPVAPLPPLKELAERAARHDLHSTSDPRWVGVVVSRRLYHSY